MDDRHLRWLQLNRGPVGEGREPPDERGRAGRRRSAGRRIARTTPVGETVSQVLASAEARAALQQRVILILAEHGGPELADAVAVRGLAAGVLTLEAPDPATSYYLRLRWEQRLVELMQCHLPEAGVRVVRFTTVGRR